LCRRVPVFRAPFSGFGQEGTRFGEARFVNAAAAPATVGGEPTPNATEGAYRLPWEGGDWA
jgi:hypothetical protein